MLEKDWNFVKKRKADFSRLWSICHKKTFLFFRNHWEYQTSLIWSYHLRIFPARLFLQMLFKGLNPIPFSLINPFLLFYFFLFFITWLLVNIIYWANILLSSSSLMGWTYSLFFPFKGCYSKDSLASFSPFSSPLFYLRLVTSIKVNFGSERTIWN